MDQEEIIDLCLPKLLQGILEIWKWVIHSNYKVYTFKVYKFYHQFHIILEKSLVKVINILAQWMLHFQNWEFRQQLLA